MPVPVRVYSAGQKDSTDFRLTNTINNQEFLVKINFPVAALKIDPDYWLASKTATITGNEELQPMNDFSVYPNPVSGMLTVLLPTNEKCVSIKLLSVEGQMIKEYNDGTTTLDFSNLPSGIYILQVETVKKVFNKKIIRE